MQALMRKITYWRSFIKCNGLTYAFYIFYRKIHSYLFLSRGFVDCKSILLVGENRISGKKNIKIDHLIAGERFRMDALCEFMGKKFNPKISIGKNVSFGTDAHIACVAGIEIGDNFLAGSRVTIIDHDHGIYAGLNEFHSMPSSPPANRNLFYSPVVIGNNVHVGENSIILKGVTIGDGAVIAAGSVVVSSISPNTISAGNPAKPVKYFDDDLKTWCKVTNHV